MNSILYARVSTDKQAQKDLSIPAQIAAMKQYAKSNGLNIVGHFVDEGESARTADRPELKRLIQHCKENKDVDVVIVHKIDRLARNLVDYATIKTILKQRGIRLVSVCEPFDDNPVGHLLENIIASISEWYSANLGEEIKKSNLIKLQKGEWPHKPPLGYMSVPGEDNRPMHVPNPKTAPIVRQAFELYATGNYSLYTLAEEMFERGLKTRTGRMLSQELMKRLLKRRFYIGRLDWHGKEYNGKHEPIIPLDLFQRVQDVLKRRSVDTGEKGRLQFLLRGVAHCDSCGRKLTGEVHPRGSYYRCLPDAQRTKCNEHYIPVKYLDDQLVALYEKLQPSKELLELVRHEIETVVRERRGTAKGEIATVKQTIAELEQKEMRLLDEMLSGKMDRTIYEKMQQQYTEQRRQSESRLIQMEVDYDDPQEFLDKCIGVAGMLSQLHQKFDFDQKKNLVRAVFEKIYVQDRGILSVKLNPPFSFLLGDDLERLLDNHVDMMDEICLLRQVAHADRLLIINLLRKGQEEFILGDYRRCQKTYQG